MRALAGALLALAMVAGIWPAVVSAEPAFGQPSAVAQLGQPLSFSSTVGGVDGGRVEVLVRLAGAPTNVVIEASQGDGDTWQATSEIDVASSSECACHFPGLGTPNTRIEYQFRVRGPDGTVSLGPVGTALIADERFEWRTLEGELVRVHWYEGDEAFARRALDVAEEAIRNASALLNADLAGRVDLFVYATEDALRSAVSPNRENIAGQAHPSIQTMFVWMTPQDAIFGFTDTLVAHELTHLVFDAATDNPYHGPPRWLNEGIAVYLSEGYAASWRQGVESAVASNSVIPLDGLGGLFPTTQERFFLAYAESVAAVDFFIATHGEQTLWDLVRSYSQGLSDDDAFRAATGGDLAAFNAAWIDSLGVDVPQPHGPQPAPTGPLPPGWDTTGQPSPAPTNGAGQTLGPSASPGTTPGGTPPPSPPPTTGNPEDVAAGLVVLVVAGVAVLVLAFVLIGILVLADRQGRRG